MKNLHGQLYKFFILTFFALQIVNFSPAQAYETAILHYPDRDWKAVSYERKDEEQEIIAKFVPIYDEPENWNEMLIFHSYKWAKQANEGADSFIETIVGYERDKFGKIETKKLKSETDDAIMQWCAYKSTKTDPAQCALVRVVKGHETVVAINYITRNINSFEYSKKALWLPVLANATIYYSYWRWNRMMNKALCVEL